MKKKKEKIFPEELNFTVCCPCPGSLGAWVFEKKKKGMLEKWKKYPVNATTKPPNYHMYDSSRPYPSNRHGHFCCLFTGEKKKKKKLSLSFHHLFSKISKKKNSLFALCTVHVPFLPPILFFFFFFFLFFFFNQSNPTLNRYNILSVQKQNYLECGKIDMYLKT